MARKKIVFVIVEGPSDEQALGVMLNRIYDNETVYIHIMRKDITTERGNMLVKIGDVIRSYANSNHFTKSDFKEIIHIVDMDGAYIPNDNIVEDMSAECPRYSVTEIRTRNKLGIEKRNLQKSSNINWLCSCKEIWGVPYRIFYMSCNLDHVLYNKLNSTDEEKEDDSFKFAIKYKEKISEFLTFISASDFSVVCGYKESWEFIKKDLHSLERHTNLGLCFQNDEVTEQNPTN